MSSPIPNTHKSRQPQWHVRTPALVLVLMTAVALFLSACGPGKLRKPALPSAPIENSASRLEQQGQYSDAAREYLRLAQRERGDTALQLRLRAAHALLLGRFPEQADKLLRRIEIGPDNSKLWMQKQFLLADVASARNKPLQVLALLKDLDTSNLPLAQRQHYHELRARAYEHVGNMLEAARQRIALDALLASRADPDSEPRTSNLAAIWDDLSRVSSNALLNLVPPADDPLAGWMSLALIARTSLQGTSDLTEQIDVWQDEYPQHPAEKTIVPLLTPLVAGPGQINGAIRHIGLILPFSGKYASSAEALRDAFLAARYADTGNTQPPRISLYDSDSAHIWSIYADAVRDGVDFMVGPLSKQHIETLVSAESLPVPTLALNTIEAGNDGTQPGLPDNLYQFGLPPEDEARQIAQHAWFAGYVKALTIVPAGSWGDRVLSAFRQYWLELGGEVVGEQRFRNDANDFSAPIKQLLNVDDSRRRRRTLQSRLGRPLKFEARRRQDIDFVFLGGFPVQVRQIRPQLSFHQAADIPVLSTSHAYTGHIDSEADRDMNGISFPDMPWILDNSEIPVRSALHALWPDRNPGLERLYALGVDAYRILPYLPSLQAQRFARYQGQTGTLDMDKRATLHRQLMWAKFVNGKPRVLHSASGG